jgi:hypothetical protein
MTRERRCAGKVVLVTATVPARYRFIVMDLLLVLG